MQFTIPTVLDGEWIGTIHMDGDDFIWERGLPRIDSASQDRSTYPGDKQRDLNSRG